MMLFGKSHIIRKQKKKRIKIVNNNLIFTVVSANLGHDDRNLWKFLLTF